MNIGIIIQLRTGSSRLTNKVLLPFFRNELLIDVFLKKFNALKSKYPVIVATTTNAKDAIIAEYAIKYGLLEFKGSENDVLQRFIDAAEFNKVDVIIRVCGDNPFLYPQYIENLIEEFQKNDTFDYISYKSKNGIPTIRTHYGFFSELVKLSALKKTAALTNEGLYREHVTNYIYNHKEAFKLNLLPIPFAENDSVRLTVDTAEDFEMTQKVFSHFEDINEEMIPEKIMKYVCGNTAYLELMKKQIQKQSK